MKNELRKRILPALLALSMLLSPSAVSAVGETENAGSIPSETTETERILGDINADGAVDIADALKLFNHSMLPEQIPVDYPDSLDFDRNISVDLGDALRLFRYSMLPDQFPISRGDEVYRPEGFDINNILAAKQNISATILPYRLYVPEDYDPNVKYALIVYLHHEAYRGKDNQTQLEEVQALFANPNSPAYRSIVLIPQCPESATWTDTNLNGLTKLIDYINETYSTDTGRQYYIGSSSGSKRIFRWMEETPYRISSCLTQDTGYQNIYMIRYPDDSIVNVGFTEDMLDIPMGFLYNSRFVWFEAYHTTLRENLLETGAKEVFIKGVSSLKAIMDFADENDISALEWLFAQNRTTGKAPETTPLETSAPEQKPEEEIEYSGFNTEEEFAYGEFTSSNGITLPYRYYIPKDYDVTKEYPLLVYLHGNGAQGTDNKKPLKGVQAYFVNAKSPVFESIVVVPQCPEGWWRLGSIDAVAELMDYINSQYSTDLSRQYVTGTSMGGDGTWDLLCRYPDKISAAVPVAGAAFDFSTNPDGTVSPKGYEPQMLDVHIYHIYDTTDEYFDAVYQRSVNRFIMDLGSEYNIYSETSKYGHGICSVYVNAKNISVLEWLFAQRRETGTAQ